MIMQPAGIGLVYYIRRFKLAIARGSVDEGIVKAGSRFAREREERGGSARPSCPFKLPMGIARVSPSMTAGEFINLRPKMAVDKTWARKLKNSCWPLQPHRNIDKYFDARERNRKDGLKEEQNGQQWRKCPNDHKCLHENWSPSVS